jgi:hypothetical protein
MFTLPKQVTESYQPKIRYTTCTFDNAAITLAPFFEDSDICDHNTIYPSFFVPAPGMEAKYLCITRVENDRCQLHRHDRGSELMYRQ